MPSVIKDAKHLQIPLKDISLATDGFADKNLVAKGGFGTVYKGVSKTHGHVAIKRWDHGQQGDREFKTEIALLSKHKHENIVSLLGFCDEGGEKILVYKYENNMSLDQHLNSKDLNWIQRLQICLEAARGLKYLHYDVGRRERILHRDVKSSNILLDKNWKPKISDFGLARMGPANMKSSFVISNVCGTRGYIAPEYHINGYLTQKSDVYSFGVVLWEVLSGRLAHVVYNDERVVLSILVQRHYKSGTLTSIIPSYLHNQINTASLLAFTDIAYQCLKNEQERPTMRQVVEQLQKALDNQLVVNNPNDEKRVEEEAKQAVGDEKNEVGSKDPPPSPLPQDIVLSAFMHCENCARKVKRCLKGFEGVEDVRTDCEAHKVIVKGENADPWKVLERVKKKYNQKVELLFPEQKPQPEERKKRKQEYAKPQQKKDVEPAQRITVVLKVYMHCQACARDIKKCILMMKGVDSAVLDPDNSLVVVKGTFRAEELADHVHNKLGKKAVIMNQDPHPDTEEANSG